MTQAEVEAFASPLLRVRRGDDPPVLRLAGEADFSNRGELEAILSAVLGGAGERLSQSVLIDARELVFLDAGSAHMLVRLARSASAPVRIVDCSTVVLRVFGMVGADQAPRLTLVAAAGSEAAGRPSEAAS
ncbi:MAG: hypothetical protein HOV79_17235 [Hamadaea sp.]|nr:hypothetical protein [Hamadaea sp.]